MIVLTFTTLCMTLCTLSAEAIVHPPKESAPKSTVPTGFNVDLQKVQENQQLEKAYKAQENAIPENNAKTDFDPKEGPKLGVSFFYPFWEPKVQEYFKPLANFSGEPRTPEEYKGPNQAEIPVFDRISREKVIELSIHGQPFVVRDSSTLYGQGETNVDPTSNINQYPWPFWNFTCKDFADRWPSGDMRDEMDHHSRREVGDSKWHSTSRYVSKGFEDHISGGKKAVAPFVWHVKDETPVWMKRELQEHWVTPNWASGYDARTMRETFEIWFSPPGGAAVFAHADSYCDPTVSWQIKGTKRWRDMMYPGGDSLEHRFETFDEGIYHSKSWYEVPRNESNPSKSEGMKKVENGPLWKPEYEFDLAPGELHVFFPNYMHETYITPKKSPEEEVKEADKKDTDTENKKSRKSKKPIVVEHDDDSDCAIASTFQYNLARNTRFMRTFLPRMMNSPLEFEERCPQSMSEYIWLGYHQQFEQEFPKFSSSVWRKQAAWVLERIDVNKDESISPEELRQYVFRGGKRPSYWFATGSMISHTVVKNGFKDQIPEGAPAEPEIFYEAARQDTLEVRIKELLGWHDRNEDGHISGTELWESIAQYHILQHRADAQKQLLQKFRGQPSHSAKSSKLVAKWKAYDEKAYGKVRKGLPRPKKLYQGEGGKEAKKEKNQNRRLKQDHKRQEL